ncbi:hypothetical protein [Sorangium sp. So ce128]|uniref:hypothetical protein n=1 Tax=Sorangium sp. So ce128 TaxID=3133281 RepID=UPI003F5F2596
MDRKIVNMVRSAFGIVDAKGSNPAPAGNPADAVVKARAALAAAERDAADAAERFDEREAQLQTVEGAFDEDPSDTSGAAVISARNARDLAKLQRDRAHRRQEDARRALAQAEHEAERARLTSQLDELEQRHHAALEGERRALAARIAAHPARTIIDALRAAEERAARATAEHEKADAALEATTAELAELEAKVMAIAPERAEELRARAEQRNASARAELAARATLAAAKARFTPIVDLTLAAEALIRKSLADIDAVVDDARADAKRAQELGAADVKPIDEFHKLIHLFHAQFMALPEQAKHWNDHQHHLQFRCGLTPPLGGCYEKGYQFKLQQPSKACIEMVFPTTKETIQALLNSATADDARATVSAIQTRIKEEQGRAAREAPKASRQTPSERPLTYARSFQDIMGDYLPRVGGIVAPNMGRRAS